MKDVLEFLSVLADSTRLNIVGLLAQRPRSGDELATILGTKPPTISHHIARLEDAGLVSATAQQYYKIYALNPAVLGEYAGALTPANLANRVSQDEAIDANAYAAKILSRWLRDDRLQGIPRKLQHQRAVYAWLTDKFAQDVRYDSDQVGELVEQWCHPNFCTELIRRLVDDNYLARLADGSWLGGLIRRWLSSRISMSGACPWPSRPTRSGTRRRGPRRASSTQPATMLSSSQSWKSPIRIASASSSRSG